MVTFHDCVLWISCLRRSGSIVVAVLICWIMCPCCTSHSWQNKNGCLVNWRCTLMPNSWWRHSDDASQMIMLCWCVNLTTVLTLFKHYKTNVLSEETHSLQWGTLNIRESNTRSKVPFSRASQTWLLIHQCNAVALAVSCPLALLKQYRSIQSNEESNNMYAV